ncbi:MAG: hypothetical protein C4547_13880 [Phycisphaerales bacterium]|nr:MAG: hypothetical protein C4547_13880 [Phycisphaerales bacterium]
MKMSVQFILGRAGSGKTHACVAAVQARLRQDPVGGPRLILLVPEQASLQMERAILGGGVGAAHRAEVLSFRRLAHRVMDEAGVAPREPLSESARVMVLRRLMSRFQPELRYYRRLDRAPGFARQLGDTVSELIEEAVTPDELSAAAAAAHEGLAAKLHDLSLIYRAYVEYLGQRRVDPSQVLELARSALPRCPWLHGAELWVDGFASLSGQEEATLVALAPLCRSVSISLLLDPAVLDGSAADAAADVWREIFDQTVHTCRRLDERLRRAGCHVEAPLRLAAPPEALARRSPALTALERKLFTGEAAVPSPKEAADDVEIAACGSRRTEVEYAVSRIVAWVHGRNFRYRDVALIVRDLQPYHDLISAALNARDIPYFLDRRRPVAHHPLIAWLNGVTALAVSPYALDVVRALLKTGLTTLQTGEADELENVLIEHGIAGRRAWHAAEWSFVGADALFEPEDDPSTFQARRIESMERTRAAFRGIFDPWIDFARAHGAAEGGADGHTGPQWAAALRELMERAEVESTLEAWAERAEAEGRLDDAEQHRQIWRDASKFLDDLETTFDDVKVSAGELADMIDAGLSRLTLGLAPPMLDQVLVGSIDRSRHPTIKAAVVLGFNDGWFPQRIREGAILHDDDRTALIERGLPVRPPRRRRVFEERLLAYIAVTRPTRKLVITYATQDETGRELRPSAYLGAIQEALPGVVERAVGHPGAGRQSWDVLTERDLAARLALEFRNRPAIEYDNDADRRGQWNGLYQALRSRPASDHTRQAMAGLGDYRNASLSEASAEGCYPEPLSLSVSRLETFASCPFKQFARYVLDLRPRREARLEAVDVGRIHHAILEDFVREVAGQSKPLGDLSEDEIEAGVERSWQRVCARLRTELEASHARDAYLIRRASRRIGDAVQAQRVIARGGRLRPFRTEQSFGFDDADSLPAVELVTPKGRRILLRGYMDRVDLAELADEALGVVIDYKEGRNKRLDLSMAYQGVSLQLLGYLVALAQVGRTPAGRPIRPIGALLVGLSPHYESVDHPDDAPEFAIPYGLDKPRGLIHAGHLDVFDHQLPAGQRSQYYQFGLKKDGTLGWVDNSDSATPEAFAALLRRTERIMADLADRMIDGQIAVNPYRAGGHSPCTWCLYGSVCRYEPGMAPTRKLTPLKRTEILERATGE